MADERIESHWIDAFARVFDLCRIERGTSVAVLAESGSRTINVTLAELALARAGAGYFQVRVPSPPDTAPAIVRSSGASTALNGHTAAIEALKAADVVVDLTVEGLLHAPQLATILKAGTRVMMVSNEHPETLARLVPEAAMKDQVKAAVERIRSGRTMHVTSPAGSDLTVALKDAATAGVWGWTDRPGTVAHWPAGVVVSFPARGCVNGRLVLAPGDVNLTFKRYLETAVTLTIEDDYVTAVDGAGADARLMGDYLAAWGDREAYATSHVGWGLNPKARYEALTMYDKADTNGTELRCVAGNFLYSTGANEFAGRYTQGHFDLPVMGTTITIDGVAVVEDGRVVA